MKKLLVASLVALSLVAGAFAAPTYPDISREELKTAIAAGKVTLIDVNGSSSYQAGHIPTAKDYAVISADFATHLPKDKSALVVAYCGSPKCGAYKRAAEAAAKLGYTNVRHFSGGISGWREAGEKVATP
jgi:rhodanese-related sulfurtransferase